MLKNLRETYQLKIQLNGIRPPVWRRFSICNISSLEDFHYIIQIVMGWTDSHLHQFTVGRERYGPVDPELGLGWGDDLRDEIKFKVKDVLKKEGDSILYEYDFGDGWEHKIVLEKITPYKAEDYLPYCVKGKRACPPEDIGGVWGYANFLEIWNDKNHPEYGEAQEWVEESFQPEEFDIAQVNEILREVFTDV